MLEETTGNSDGSSILRLCLWIMLNDPASSDVSIMEVGTCGQAFAREDEIGIDASRLLSG
jgi:hypothetical protein